MIKYYDIHTHRNVSAFVDENTVAIHSLSQEEMEKGFNIDIGNQYFSCGIHPWHIEDSKIALSDLHQLAITNKKIVAIGECGLDRLIDTPMEIQKQVFSSQIELAEKLELPVVIHCVKAWDELLELYKKYKPKMPWILHGFRGGKQQVEQLSKFGFCFSIGEHFNEEALSFINLENLFIETDESLLSIENIYNRVGDVLSVEKGVLRWNVMQNVSRLFKI